jgi:hypothetical protein
MCFERRGIVGEELVSGRANCGLGFRERLFPRWTNQDIVAQIGVSIAGDRKRLGIVAQANKLVKLTTKLLDFLARLEYSV